MVELIYKQSWAVQVHFIGTSTNDGGLRWGIEGSEGSFSVFGTCLSFHLEMTDKGEGYTHT